MGDSATREAAERNVYASDGEISICRIIDEDRENYVELHRQLNGEETLFLNPVCKDMMWDIVLNGEDEVYSIFEENGDYCGSMEIQKPSCECPEIGIDLMVECRNQGIAPRAVRLLTEEFYRRHVGT